MKILSNKVSFLIIILTSVIMMMILSTTQSTFAAKKSFDEKCSYNGKKIVTDYSSKKFKEAIKNMEPGDTLDYKLQYTNKSDKTTLWYMKNEVLETLEDNSDQAENGGYTYILKAGGQTLFNNSAVGGEKVVNKLQGLKQATNATKDYFFIEELKPGKSGTTTLHVELDGETGVNTYMDTQGALSFQYAVEEKGKRANPDNPGTRSRIKTGDMNRIIYYVVLLSAAVLLLVIAVVIWRRDRKRGEDA